MDSLRKLTGQCRPAFLAVLIVGLLLSGPNPATFAQAPVPESPFANVNQPVGVAATPGRLLVTHPFCGNPREVLSIDGAGSVSVFATLPPIPAGTCVEDYIAIAPASSNIQAVAGFPTKNPAGFKSNFVYVTQGPTIFQIDLAGTVSTFATISSCPASSNGITFDRVGTFGNRLIVVCANGQVWLLSAAPGACPSAGCQMIATVTTNPGEFAEGPDVAPLATPLNAALPGLGGQLLVTVGKQGGGGKIFAVSNAGAVTTVATGLASPESIAFVPTAKCTLGLSSAVYFKAVLGGNTVDSLPLKIPNTATFVFAGLGGDALVTTEGAGITLLSAVNGKIATSTFEPFFAELQGQVFVDCTTPLIDPIIRTSGPISIGPGAQGDVTVDFLATVNFDPGKICTGTATVDGIPCPFAKPTGGINGTENSFDGCIGLVSTPQGPAARCKFSKFSLSGTPRSDFTGPLIFKFFYLGPTGDDAAEGSG